MICDHSQSPNQKSSKKIRQVKQQPVLTKVFISYMDKGHMKTLVVRKGTEVS